MGTKDIILYTNLGGNTDVPIASVVIDGVCGPQCGDVVSTRLHDKKKTSEVEHGSAQLHMLQQKTGGMRHGTIGTGFMSTHVIKSCVVPTWPVQIALRGTACPMTHSVCQL